MPIRINLLAEEQALEEQRRRDPVKRALLGAAGLVCCALLASAAVQANTMLERMNLSDLEKEWAAKEKSVKDVADQLKKTTEIEQKLASLHQLATNRFLWGPVLNALQFCQVPSVHVTKVRTEQKFVVTEATKPKPDSKEKPKPATSTEQISILISAADTGNPEHQNYNKFREALANHPFFKERIARDGVRLKELPPPVPNPANPSQTLILFTIEILFPPKVR